MSKAIEACLFDLGNVLLFFSHERMWQQMAEVMGVQAETVRAVLAKDELHWRYEAGQIPTSELVAIMRGLATKDFDDATLARAAGDIYQPNLPMLPILSRLKESGQRLVIVSNTNELHMAFAEAHYECFKYFDDVVYSHRVRAMKPNEAYYEAALVTAGVPRERCLFTDDMPVNVEAAARFGFDAVLFESAAAFDLALRGRAL